MSEVTFVDGCDDEDMVVACCTPPEDDTPEEVDDGVHVEHVHDPRE